jgi:hypothetical protein
MILSASDEGIGRNRKVLAAKEGINLGLFDRSGLNVVLQSHDRIENLGKVASRPAPVAGEYF